MPTLGLPADFFGTLNGSAANYTITGTTILQFSVTLSMHCLKLHQSIAIYGAYTLHCMTCTASSTAVWQQPCTIMTCRPTVIEAGSNTTDGAVATLWGAGGSSQADVYIGFVFDGFTAYSNIGSALPNTTFTFCTPLDILNLDRVLMFDPGAQDTSQIQVRSDAPFVLRSTCCNTTMVIFLARYCQ